MSWSALAWAAKRRVDRATDKLILLALAERHNEETEVAYPSVTWLADFSSLDRKTVIAALGRLEAAGLISDSGQRFGQTLQVKGYRLHIETVPKTEQSQKRNSTDFPPKQSQKRDTDTVLNQGSEAKASSPKCAKFSAPDGVPDDVWGDFLNSPKRRKAGMSATAYAGIRNKLTELAEHGYPPGEMIALAVERGWTTVRLDWVKNDGQQRTDRMGRNQPSDGLSSTTRAALRVFGTGE